MAYPMRTANQPGLEPYSDIPGVRNSNPDLDDYFDGQVPPPHHLSTSQGHTPIPLDDPVPRNPFMASREYSNVDSGNGASNVRQSTWLEKQQSNQRRTKWIVIGSLLGILGIIIVGVAVGVTVSKHHSNKKGTSSTGNPGSSTTPPGTVNQTNPNDPSSFQKDPRLHQSFYGLAYTPEGSQLPQCGAQLSDVITDIQLLSQLTTNIRLYGADCNQSGLVLEAIQQTKVNMSVWLGIYNVPDDHTAYDRQKAEIMTVLQKYGTKNVAGVTVGNEWMLNYLSDNGGAQLDPNGAVGNTGAQLLIVNITDMRNTLSAASINIPVGNSDAGSYFNTQVLNAIDYGLSNVHPWFANVTVQSAAAWTEDFFETNNVQVAANTTKQPQMYIAETGWPTKSSDAGNANNGASDASEANLQVYLDTFVCDANTKGIKYFFFEYFDEPWKDAQFGGVEGWWGLFNSNRTLKNINIPNCAI